MSIDEELRAQREALLAIEKACKTCKGEGLCPECLGAGLKTKCEMCAWSGLCPTCNEEAVARQKLINNPPSPPDAWKPNIPVILMQDSSKK